VHRRRAVPEGVSEPCTTCLVALVGAPPDVASLPSTEEWFAQPEPATRWRIEGLVEEGHNLLLGGKTKVSKTTLTLDLARALTNGEERWLDEFALSPPTGQVGWINCEMTEAQFRRWLRSAGVNPSRLRCSTWVQLNHRPLAWLQLVPRLERLLGLGAWFRER